MVKLAPTPGRGRQVDSALGDEGWADVGRWEHLNPDEAMLGVRSVALDRKAGL